MFGLYISRHEVTEPRPYCCSMFISPLSPDGPDCSTAALQSPSDDSDHWQLTLPTHSWAPPLCLRWVWVGRSLLGGEERSSDDIQTRSWPRPLIGHQVTMLLSDWSELSSYLVRDQPETGLVGPELWCEWWVGAGGMDWFVWIENLVLCYLDNAE